MRILALLLLGACGSGEDSDPELGPCEGGGTPTLVVGSSGPSGLTPWEDGDRVPLETIDDALSLKVTAAVSGVDATEQVTAVVRVAWDGSATDDYVGSFVLDCEEPAGESPLTVVAKVPQPWQTNPTDLDGAVVPLTLTVSDLDGRSATQSLSVELATP